MKINMVLIVKQIFLLSWAGTQTFIVALVFFFGCTNQLLHSLHTPTALVTLYVPQSHISAKIGGLLSAWFIKPRA